MNSSVYRHLGVQQCRKVYWCTSVCTAVCTGLLQCVQVSWCTAVYTGVLVYSGVYGCSDIQLCAHCTGILVYSFVYCSFLVYSGLYVCPGARVCTVCNSIIHCTLMCPGIHSLCTAVQVTCPILQVVLPWHMLPHSLRQEEQGASVTSSVTSSVASRAVLVSESSILPTDKEQLTFLSLPK